LVASGLFNPKWLGLPIVSTNRTIIAQNKQLQAFTSMIIAEKIEKITAEMEEDSQQAADVVGDETKVKDLVDVIIRTNLEMKKKDLSRFGKTETMNATELEGQLQVILFAGYETSSATTVSLSWVVLRVVKWLPK
jgi:galactitol-specific phosphotransferase system IIB component